MDHGEIRWNVRVGNADVDLFLRVVFAGSQQCRNPSCTNPLQIRDTPRRSILSRTMLRLSLDSACFVAVAVAKYPYAGT